MNLPMMYQQSVEENRDWFEVLDEYLQLIRGIHKRTYSYLCKFKASSNPLAYCEGGFDGGNLKPNDTIEPVLKYSTLSFAYGGLNELSLLAIGKPHHEDPSFALATMEHINKRINEFKKKDKLLYAIYKVL